VLLELVLLIGAVVLVVLVLLVVFLILFMRLPKRVPRLPRLIEPNSLSLLPFISDERTWGNRQKAKIARARTILFMVGGGRSL